MSTHAPYTLSCLDRQRTRNEKTRIFLKKNVQTMRLQYPLPTKEKTRHGAIPRLKRAVPHVENRQLPREPAAKCTGAVSAAVDGPSEPTPIK